MLGFISKKKLNQILDERDRLNTQALEKQAKEFRRLLDETERSFSRRLSDGPTQQLYLSDTNITLDNLIQKILDLYKEKIQQATSNINIESLNDKVYQDIDTDQVVDRIAEILKDPILKILDLKVVAEAMAQAIVEENDAVDLFDSEELIEKIAENLQITYNKPSSD